MLGALTPLLPANITAYCEPFVGGGALLFCLQPKTAFVNDINGELISVYRVIRDDVERLIARLREFRNDARCFYEVRGWDRDAAGYALRSDVERAVRVLYLNKTCYNGLFRVNASGEFNSPFGSYRNPNIVNAEALRAVSVYLNTASVSLTSLDYAEVLETLPSDTFVYLDPPYDPVSPTSNFTGYSRGGFSRADQLRLRECCDRLNERGLRFMLSNSATDFVKELYAGYNVTVVKARRAVNSDGAGRSGLDEVVVRNYC